MKKQYVIKSTERHDDMAPAYFAAIHRSTPMYFGIDKAQKFDTHEGACRYALTELFTDRSAFVVEAVAA